MACLLSVEVCETTALVFHHFYSILFYSPLQLVFLVQTTFVSYFDFFDGFEQNKMNKGVIICLHHDSFISSLFAFYDIV